MGMKKVLLFGPYSPPITGQNQAFRSVVESFDTNDFELIDTTKYDNRFVSTLYVMFLTFLILIFNKHVDIIYFTSSRSKFGAIKDLPLLLIGGLLKKPIINHLHGADFKKFYLSLGSFYKSIVYRAYKNIRSSIVLTHSMQDQYDVFTNMDLFVVNNFYPKVFDSTDIKKICSKKVIYFSNLMMSKGILEFINAAIFVSKHKPEIEFLIVGEYMSDHIANKNVIERLVKKLLNENADVNIKYLGRLDPSKKQSLLLHTGIFVLPTFYPTEGVPLTILEAMRCGNVIITTDHNYLSEVIDNRNGALVEPLNTEELALKILDFLSQEDRLIKVQEFNMKYAIETFSEEVYLERINSIINSYR